jgi:predicted nucleic acid-binding protein
LILVDTSVWVDHLRRGDAHLMGLLEQSKVIVHPFVIGEIACGSLSDRGVVLQLLDQLPGANVAEPDEALAFIERHALHGKGVGHVDVHLLTAVALTAGSRLWTRDKRLRSVADALGCAYVGAGSR